MHTLCNFHNEFIDWLCIGNAYLNLRTELQLSRDQLGALIGISGHTIRRYETENKAPKWYLIMLRVLCGDLSLYGQRWVNARIQPHDRKLKAPELQSPLYPVELNAMYNSHAHQARTQTAQERRRADNLAKEIEAIKQLNLELLSRIDLLETENARLRAHKNGLKSGKVISLFKGQNI